MKPTICLDFDGVIHAYTSGWQGAANVPDGIVEGTKEAVARLRERFTVKVFSARCGQEGGVEAIKEFLSKHEVEVDEIPLTKPPSLVYVDDRGVTFKGDWDSCIEEIMNFRQWQKAAD
jgi:hypothetical protein